MSRLLSWLLPALLIAGGWFAWKEGKPRFKRWQIKATAEQVCKDTANRVMKGLNHQAAADSLQIELRARMRDRAGLELHEDMYQTELWQGRCTVRIKLKDGTQIRAQAPFPTEN